MRKLLLALVLIVPAPVLLAESPSSIAFCTGPDGALDVCPCNNPGDSLTGCDTPVPAMQGGGTTGGIGLVPVAQQLSPANRGTMVASGFPAGSTPGAVLFRNTTLAPSPTVFGDGVLCVAATSSLVRIGGAVAINGQSTHTFGHGTMSGSGSFFYQVWFRSFPASYCNPSSAFSLSSGATLDW